MRGMKDYKKFAAKHFKGKRLKKKQITKLTNEYKRLSKKHGIVGPISILASGPIPELEMVTFGISMVYSTNELVAQSKRGEILSIDPDTGQWSLPKDRPGFVLK